MTLKCQGQRQGKYTLCALAHQGAGHLPPPVPQGHPDKGPQKGSRDRLAGSLQQLPGGPAPTCLQSPRDLWEGRGGKTASLLLSFGVQTPPELCALGVTPPISPQILPSSYGLVAARLSAEVA